MLKDTVTLPVTPCIEYEVQVSIKLWVKRMIYNIWYFRL